MNVIMTEEQAAFVETARRFAKEKLAPNYQLLDKQEHIDRALIQEMGAMGFIGPDMPEEYGGLGSSGVTAGLIAETIAHGDFNVSWLCLLGPLMGNIVLHHAQAPLRDEWLPKMIRGEAVIALGLTEPRGGSDAANLQIKAERTADGYVLNGEKTSISFATQADAVVLFARTGKPDEGARGITAFFVPLDLPGVSRTRFSDVGNHVIGRGSLFFDNVRISESHRLGNEGKGFIQVMQGFDFSRVLIALQCIGAAQASLDETWEYTKERQAFGAPIAQYQGVSFPLAEAETLLAGARQLCYHALALRDQGLPHTAEAAMCKWWGPKLAYEVIHQCLLTHGHYGYTTDLPHQQRMRDVLGLQIGDGTAQIMKLIIAREKAGRVAVQYDKGGKK
ncbi:MAG: Acyl-CoA dehydrogenase [Rhodocyclaceae bacterium]|nr:Acyl-CoA dehydrogenase [Rhodocyclaceae bacterium]